MARRRSPLESGAGREERRIPAFGALQRIGRAVADGVLPSPCLSCDTGRVEALFRGGVCRACWERLPIPGSARCEVCDDPLPAAEATRCGRCLVEPPAFRTLRAAAPYRGSARSILLAFKFRGADYLANRMAAIMVERLAAGAGSRLYDEVASVPATARSTRRRGYHPAQILAESVAKRLDLPVPRRLRKVRDTERQSLLALARRRSNVRGAYRIRGAPPRAVLLVDDVATSGWTARECAAALAGAGARVVDVWCFARASRDDLDREELPAGEGPSPGPAIAASLSRGGL